MEFLRHGLWSYGWCLLFERSNVVHIFLVINCQLISEKYRFWFYGKPEVVAPWHMPTWHQSARARLLLPSVDRLQLPTAQLFALTQVPALHSSAVCLVTWCLRRTGSQLGFLVSSF